MLADMNVPWVIVGHSERRQLCGETNEIVATKAAFAIQKGLSVIGCIGESLEEREAGKLWDVSTHLPYLPLIIYVDLWLFTIFEVLGWPQCQHEGEEVCLVSGAVGAREALHDCYSLSQGSLLLIWGRIVDTKTSYPSRQIAALLRHE